MLLLEPFAWKLLRVALVVWACTAHTLLESFAVSNWSSSSILLDACSTGRAWSHWLSCSCLTRSTSLNIVSSLCHTNSWTWFELFNWLSIPEAHSCLILVQCLLVSRVRILLVLLLLLIHVCIWEEATCWTGVCGCACCCSCSWLLYLVCLIHVSWCAYAQCCSCFLLIIVLISYLRAHHGVILVWVLLIVYVARTWYQSSFAFCCLSCSSCLSSTSAHLILIMH